MAVGGFLPAAAFLITVVAASMDSCINRLLNEANVTNCLHVFEADHEMLDALGGNIPCSLLRMPDELQAIVDYKFYASGNQLVVWDYDSLFLSVRNLSLLRKYVDTSSCKFPVKVGAMITVAFYGEAKELAELFRMLWWCRYVNVVVVTRSIQVYTYHPISRGNCTDYSFAPLLSCSRPESIELRKFSGCRLYIGGYLNRPFVNFGSFEKNTGVLVTILRVVLKALEFSPKFICPHCKGDELTPAELMTSKDLDLVHLVLTFVLHFSYDVIYYPIQDDFSIYLPPPKPLQPWRNVLQIFDWPTWLALLLSVVLLGLYLNRNFILVISILLGNTCSSTSRRLPLLWECAAVILTSAYSGLLVSFLCKSIITHDITTYEDLLHSKYKICGSYLSYLSITYIPSFQQCVKLDCEECYEKLREGTHAFFSDRYKLAYLTSLSEYRQWHKVWYQNQRRPFWYILCNKKRSPFTQVLQRYMMLIHESGLVDKLDVYKMNSGNYDLPIVDSVGLNNLYFIFVVYAICILLACIVLLLEIFLQRRLMRE